MEGNATSVHRVMNTDDEDGCNVPWGVRKVELTRSDQRPLRNRSGVGFWFNGWGIYAGRGFSKFLQVGESIATSTIMVRSPPPLHPHDHMSPEPTYCALSLAVFHRPCLVKHTAVRC